MAQVSFDGQSLALDGRRLWLLSGEIDFTAATADQWPALLATARQAGLNTIATRVAWHDHEAQPGRFDFTGDLNLRRFVELAADEGLWVILRPGPSVRDGRDQGGIPPHVQRAKVDRRSGPMRVRSASPPFMEGVSRFFKAVMEQVKDLQVTTPLPTPAPRSAVLHRIGRPAGGFQGQGGGPILLVQAEDRWHAHSPRDHDGYLRQVVRYLRENGVETPIVVANNLWQPVEGAIAGWHGRTGLTATLRQLGAVQPEAPRWVMELELGESATLDEPLGPVESPQDLQRRLLGVVSAGGQFNLDPFLAGARFGLAQGRRTGGPARFTLPARGNGAALDDSGQPTDLLAPIRRVAHFATHFGPLLASLGHENPRAVLSPQAPSNGLSVVHESGAMGELITLSRSDDHTAESARLLLPSGLELDIPLGDERSAWTVLDAKLGTVATLDYTAFRPLAFVDDKLLVLYGPAGSTGVVGIEGEHLELQAPTGRSPVVETLQGITVVLLSAEQADAFVLDPDGLKIGALATDPQGAPVPAEGVGSLKQVQPDGKTKTLRLRKPHVAAAPALGDWSSADLSALWTGESDAYAPLDRADALGLAVKPAVTARGYLALRMDAPKAANGKTLAPRAGDRLHVFVKGARKAILGIGPDAELGPISLRLAAGPVVTLVDALGRYDDGSDQGMDTKGLGAGLRHAKPLSLGKTKVEASRKPDPFALPGYHAGARQGEVGPAEQLTWTLSATAGKDVLVRVQGLPCRAVLTLNDAPVAYLGGAVSGQHTELVWTAEKEAALTPGKNTLRLELFETLTQTGRTAAQLAACVTAFSLSAPLGDPATLHFAPIETAPDADDFAPLAKSARPADAPTWFAADFDTPEGHAPVYVSLQGMTKGLIELNGRLVGRYWHAGADGKPLGPQQRYLLPRGWMNDDAPNRLCLFDEHGRHPRKVALTTDPGGAFASAR
ncbi:MAG: beta-galactosidase [Planctomycetota bacterium]